LIKLNYLKTVKKLSIANTSAINIWAVLIAIIPFD